MREKEREREGEGEVQQRILENPAAASHHWRKKRCTRVPRLTVSTKGRIVGR
jgi:hypothetical protein